MIRINWTRFQRLTLTLCPSYFSRFFADGGSTGGTSTTTNPVAHLVYTPWFDYNDELQRGEGFACMPTEIKEDVPPPIPRWSLPYAGAHTKTHTKKRGLTPTETVVKRARLPSPHIDLPALAKLSLRT